MFSVAIIGTAGRREDASKMSRRLYFSMVKAAKTQILKWGLKWSEIELKSGGAAWADHVAISLFLMFPDSKIKLFLPCKWDWDKHQYVDLGTKDWRSNPGGTLNFYHHKFSQVMGGNTLLTIERVLDIGRASICHGFHDRNRGPADSDYMIALTWATDDQPKIGGTSHTWSISRAKTRIHIPLSSL